MQFDHEIIKVVDESFDVHFIKEEENLWRADAIGPLPKCGVGARGLYEVVYGQNRDEAKSNIIDKLKIKLEVAEKNVAKPDFMINNENGLTIAFIEVIAKRPLDKYTALYYYNRVLDYAQSLELKPRYVLIMTSLIAELYKKEAQFRDPIEIDSASFLERYITPTPGISEMEHGLLEKIVKRWLLDFVNPNFEPKSEGEKTLVKEGFCDEIKNSIILE